MKIILILAAGVVSAGATVQTCADALEKEAVHGDQLWWQGRYSEAEEVFRALMRKASAAGCADFNSDSLLERLGLALYEQARYSEAEALYRRRLRSVATPQDAEAARELALVLNAQAKYDEADRLLHSALRVHEAHLGATHPFTLLTLMDLSGVLINRREFARAEPILRRVAALLEATPAQPGMLARCYQSLALVHLMQHEPGKAGEYVRRSRTAAERSPAENPSEVAANLAYLIEIAISLRDPATAAQLLPRAMRVAQASVGSVHPITERLIYARGELHYLAGDYAAAEADMLAAIQIEKGWSGAENERLAMLLSGYAKVLRAAKRIVEAKQTEGQAKQIVARNRRMN
jgi:tetratricopeptide (TPR) repeat protein